MQLLMSIVVGLILALVVIFIHHESLVRIKCRVLGRRGPAQHWHVGLTVLLLLLSHVMEIMIFAIGMYLLAVVLGQGALHSPETTDFKTFFYFSFSCYTSLGIGDLYPVGDLRLVTGFEALIGLLMIGWSASFLYLEMNALWNDEGLR